MPITNSTVVMFTLISLWKERRGRHGCDRIVVGFTTMIKFVSDFRQVSGFLCVLWLSSTNKTDLHDITNEGRY